jgi:hypothetical protein
MSLQEAEKTKGPKTPWHKIAGVSSVSADMGRCGAAGRRMFSNGNSDSDRPLIIIVKFHCISKTCLNIEGKKGSEKSQLLGCLTCLNFLES